jgi:hypothetical protein
MNSAISLQVCSRTWPCGSWNLHLQESQSRLFHQDRLLSWLCSRKASSSESQHSSGPCLPEREFRGARHLTGSRTWGNRNAFFPRGFLSYARSHPKSGCCALGPRGNLFLSSKAVKCDSWSGYRRDCILTGPSKLRGYYVCFSWNLSTLCQPMRTSLSLRPFLKQYQLSWICSQGTSTIFRMRTTRSIDFLSTRASCTIFQCSSSWYLLWTD